MSFYSVGLQSPTSHPFEDHFDGYRMVKSGYCGILKDRGTRNAWKKGMDIEVVGAEERKGGVINWFIETILDLSHLLLIGGGLILLINAMGF